MDPNTITIVSGLPRSGTSMMMSMLEAGGMEILTDRIRKADKDNPKGYYEYEKVKEIENDKSWLENAKGKGVKIISELLRHLPKNYFYKIIFMHRNMEEILASQNQMLIRRNKPTNSISSEKITKLFGQHLENVKTWIEAQPNINVLYVNYNEIIEDKGEKELERINLFLGEILDIGRMKSIIDKKLYRQRK
jgi:hypothetical protein